ncbi:unnamed protein product [Sphagnum troendelagicum]|uniref:Uncharacterized protein n=1 Tax=Sphagnum troendelagicum TaxID=128251 RepID=A0ABP0U4V8_9BRYO
MTVMESCKCLLKSKSQEEEEALVKSKSQEKEKTLVRSKSEEEEETLKINMGTDTAAVLVLLRTKKSVIYL